MYYIFCKSIGCHFFCQTVSKGDTPLHYAVRSGDPELVRRLLSLIPPEKLKEVINISNEVSGNTPLHEAACQNSQPVNVQKAIVELLVKYGADTKRRNKSNRSAKELPNRNEVSS